MLKIYKKAALAVAGCCICQVGLAQTHYGIGAGTQGQAHAHFGVNAGKVSSGAFNTFIGEESGANNGVAVDNTFVGYKSGMLNGTGISNTFIGSNAGAGNIHGSANTFLGKDAGLSNVDGNSNTYVGFGAGAIGTSGSNNCALGFLANYHSTQGSYNVFVGGQAGENNAGSDNIVIGYAAGLENAGNLNVFAGNYAGFNNAGNANTYLGNNAGYHGTTVGFNTYVGSKSGFFNVNGIENVFVGTEAGYNNASGQSNVFLGFHAGEQNVGGRKNTYIGHFAGGTDNLINATAIGALAKVTADNSIVLGNKANVGIGISAPAFQLHLSTDAAAKPGSQTWTVASDSRLKKNIADFTDGLDLLKQIRPVRFQYNGQAGIETGDKQFVGIIAQEMQKIAPYTVGTFTHQDSLGNKTEYLDYDANAVTYILINSVKEQQQIIEEKEKEIGAMRRQIAFSDEKQHALEARLEKLEQLMSATGHFQKVEDGTSPTLAQNIPNGFSQHSQIKFFIPNAAKQASINVYSSTGAKMRSYPISDRGESSLTISASDFPDGVFLYELVTDGKCTGVRKMLVNR